MKQVISATRRSDLVACYPKRLVEEVYKIGLENIHTLVIWTKNPRNLLTHRALHQLLGELEQVYLNLTVTGLEGSFLEPHVPTSNDIFHLLPEIIDLIGSPKRIALRYDPLIEVADSNGIKVSNIKPEVFLPILKQTAKLHIPIIRTSYVTLYRKVQTRLKKLGYHIVEHPLEEITGFIQEVILPEAARHGVEVKTCVVPHLTSAGGCIDGHLLQTLHPAKERCSVVKDPSQREFCHCTKSLDIGNWDPCHNGCIYCYGNPVLANESE